MSHKPLSCIFSAVENKAELGRFSGQKVRGQGHSETKCTFRQRHADRRFAVEDHLFLNLHCL